MGERYTREGIITSVVPYLKGHVVRIRMDTYLYFPEDFSKTVWISTEEKSGTLYRFFRENPYELFGYSIRVKGEYRPHYGSEFKRLVYVNEVLSFSHWKTRLSEKPGTEKRLLEIMKNLNTRSKVTEGQMRKILKSPFLPVRTGFLKDFHMCYTVYKLLEGSPEVRISRNLVSFEVLGVYFVHVFRESFMNGKRGLFYTEKDGYGLFFDYAFFQAVKNLPFIFSEEVLSDEIKELLQHAREKGILACREDELVGKIRSYLSPWFVIRKVRDNTGEKHVLYPHFYRRLRESALARIKGAPASLKGSGIRWKDADDREGLAGKVVRFIAGEKPPVFVITGSAGTGKSTFIARLVSEFHDLGISVSVTGTTGKSVRRLNELLIKAGISPLARTLARELGQRYDGTYRVERITSEVLIVDEASMLDMHRLSRINRIMSENQTLILVGDPEQLEPIGTENVFLTVVRFLRNTPLLLELERNYRFSSERKVFVIAVQNVRRIPEIILSLLRKNGILMDFQKWKVATYGHRQKYTGTQYLNTYIRKFITGDSRPFFEGEIALVVDNTIDSKTKSLKLANKEEVRVISLEGEEACVMTPTGIVRVPLDRLSYAYSVEYRTVQGEEYDFFMFIALKNKIDRNIMYTMLTRGKEKVYMLTTASSLGYIVSSFKKELKQVKAQIYREQKKGWKKVML